MYSTTSDSSWTHKGISSKVHEACAISRDFRLSWPITLFLSPNFQ
jgi:hypothetical protein